MDKDHKYKLIKIKDITGEMYEFEQSELQEGPWHVVVIQPYYLGTVTHTFERKNIIFLSTIW